MLNTKYQLLFIRFLTNFAHEIRVFLKKTYKAFDISYPNFSIQDKNKDLREYEKE